MGSLFFRGDTFKAADPPSVYRINPYVDTKNSGVDCFKAQGYLIVFTFSRQANLKP
jgi:hypothetical protein